MKKPIKVVSTVVALILVIAFGITTYQCYTKQKEIDSIFVHNYQEFVYNVRNMTVEGIDDNAVNSYKSANAEYSAVMSALLPLTSYKKNVYLDEVIAYFYQSSNNISTITFTPELYDKLYELSENMYSEVVADEANKMLAEIVQYD